MQCILEYLLFAHLSIMMLINFGVITCVAISILWLMTFSFYSLNLNQIINLLQWTSVQNEKDNTLNVEFVCCTIVVEEMGIWETGSKFYKRLRNRLLLVESSVSTNPLIEHNTIANIVTVFWLIFICTTIYLAVFEPMEKLFDFALMLLTYTKQVHTYKSTLFVVRVIQYK